MNRNRIEELTRVEKEIACYIYRLSRYNVASITFGTLFKPDTSGILRGDKNININLFSKMIGFDASTLKHAMTILENKDICSDYDLIDEELRGIWEDTASLICKFSDYDPFYLPEHMMEYIRSYYKDRLDLNYAFRIELSSGRRFVIDCKTFREALVEYYRIAYEFKGDTGSIHLMDANGRFDYIVYRKDVESMGIEHNSHIPSMYGRYRRE